MKARFIFMFLPFLFGSFLGPLPYCEAHKDILFIKEDGSLTFEWGAGFFQNEFLKIGRAYHEMVSDFIAQHPKTGLFDSIHIHLFENYYHYPKDNRFLLGVYPSPQNQKIIRLRIYHRYIRARDLLVLLEYALQNHRTIEKTQKKVVDPSDYRDSLLSIPATKVNKILDQAPSSAVRAILENAYQDGYSPYFLQQNQVHLLHPTDSNQVFPPLDYLFQVIHLEKNQAYLIFETDSSFYFFQNGQLSQLHHLKDLLPGRIPILDHPIDVSVDSSGLSSILLKMEVIDTTSDRGFGTASFIYFPPTDSLIPLSDFHQKLLDEPTSAPFALWQWVRAATLLLLLFIVITVPLILYNLNFTAF